MDTKMRSYDMTARGKAAAATRDAIISAAINCVTEQRSLAITLAAVAQRADVTVKTVLRHFGSREALLDAAWGTVLDDVLAERTVPPGDVDAAMTALIEHYERRGEMVLGLLAEETDEPRARQICESGRSLHRAWVQDVFGEHLPPQGSTRISHLDALVVVTDVYSWKILRRDGGLPVAAVHDRMLLMARALLAAAAERT